MNLNFGTSWDAVFEANEKIPVADVLRASGIYVPDLAGMNSSGKLACPWEYLHPDGGVDKSLRVYPVSNTAYCFAGCEVITPVRLHAEARGIPPQRAARELLQTYGIRPLGWRDRLLKAQEERPSVVSGWQAALVTYVHSVLPDREYDLVVVCLLDEAMGELNGIARTPGPHYEEWLERWKTQLRST